MSNSIATVSTPATGETISLLNEPSTIVESAPGAGGDFVASVHATGVTSILEAVFTSSNVAVDVFQSIALDANGNATIPVHFTASGEYLNLVTPDLLVSTASFPVVITDAADTITTIVGTIANQTLSVTGGSNAVFVTVPDTIVQTGGVSTVESSAGHMTMTASAGAQIIFDAVGGDLIGEAPSSVFVGGPGGAASTITASTGGSDTIFAGGALLYNGMGGTNSLLVGGSGAATVVSAANEVVFGGTGGGVYAPGSGSFFLFGGGGSDTISGGTASPTVWGNSNEKLIATGTAQHGVFVAFGEQDSINASAAGGGNSFVVVDQTLAVPGGTFAGNTTLVGSSAGLDTFAIFGEPGTAPPAHTITIQNWQASDTLFLGNYSATDIAAANTALGGAAVGAGASFTLSDQTTIAFVGSHPASAFS
jgi:Ca2+-binding RTX toxin-like protein